MRVTKFWVLKSIKNLGFRNIRIQGLLNPDYYGYYKHHPLLENLDFSRTSDQSVNGSLSIVLPKKHATKRNEQRTVKTRSCLIGNKFYNNW